MADGNDTTNQIWALKADNARLRRLLDEAGQHDGLRHAFRDTMATLRVILRATTETAVDVEDYAAHLEGRLDALVRVRSHTDVFGEADLQSLVSDTLAVHTVKEGDRASLAGPRVQLRPRAAQMLGLALHELASNAIEHGPLGDRNGQVEVMWRVEPGEAGPTLVLMWRETGLREPVVPRRRGFGTVVLEDMLAYDLKAHTGMSYEAEGLRCLIRFPLADRVGRLAPDADGAEEQDFVT